MRSPQQNHQTNLISAHEFLNLTLNQDPKHWYNNEYVTDHKKLELQGKLIKLAQDLGADLNNIVENSEHLYGIKSLTLFAHKDQLMTHPIHPLSADNLLRMVTRISIAFYSHQDIHAQQERIAYKALVKHAIENGADLNIKLDTSTEDDPLNLTALEAIFLKGELKIIETALKPDSKISSIAWIRLIDENPRIKFIGQAIKYFPNSLSIDHLYQLMRDYGASHSMTRGIIDLYHLVKDYVENKNLSDQEIALLSDTTQKLLAVEDYKDIDLKNKYGFTALQLAILGEKFDLAIQMLDHGHSSTEKNNNGVTAISLLKNSENDNHHNTSIKKLRTSMLEHIDNVDILLCDIGESFVDNFLANEDLRDTILSRSKDPLFEFFKKDADLFAPSQNPELTHIAISHGEGFWSTGLWSWSRLAKEKHPNIKFHLVTLEMLKKGGDAFIKQFDGWMNPGGGDDYPKKPEFNINDWKTTMVLIDTYQEALRKTFEFKIPSMGMCAGAQNLALHHEGYIKPVKGYVGGNHKILYLERTLPHFMAMTKEQQKTALEKCEFPEIIFKGDTAHSYAAVTYKLGNGLQLGAISEDGVAMSFAHENGLSYATQFHPEHHYHIETNSTNHEEALLNNFIKLAELHHNSRMGIHAHPETIFEQVSERLDQCMEAPTCLIGTNSVFNNATIEIAMFGN